MALHLSSTAMWYRAFSIQSKNIVSPPMLRQKSKFPKGGDRIHNKRENTTSQLHRSRDRQPKLLHLQIYKESDLACDCATLICRLEEENNKRWLSDCTDPSMQKMARVECISETKGNPGCGSSESKCENKPPSREDVGFGRMTTQDPHGSSTAARQAH